MCKSHNVCEEDNSPSTIQPQPPPPPPSIFYILSIKSSSPSSYTIQHRLVLHQQSCLTSFRDRFDFELLYCLQCCNRQYWGGGSEVIGRKVSGQCTRAVLGWGFKQIHTYHTHHSSPSLSPCLAMPPASILIRFSIVEVLKPPSSTTASISSTQLCSKVCTLQRNMEQESSMEEGSCEENKGEGHTKEGI